MLDVVDLHVAYGESEVLHGLNFDVRPAEIVAVMGRNGMGKTTLMKSLMGIAPAARGTITLDGTDVTSIKTHRRVAAGFGYVPQGRAIFSAMTVEENVETGLSSTGERQPPAAIYELFPVLVEMRGRRGGNLSGGQQQQLAVARALASKPKVLLLDEPTEGLQPSIIKEMAQALCRIRDEWGLTIVVSEQVLSFAVDVADRVLVMENGNFVHESAREGIDEAKISKFLSV
jgi:urea transport system ATP-binding protein